METESGLVATRARGKKRVESDCYEWETSFCGDKLGLMIAKTL